MSAREHTEVLVIGAGLAGSVVARRLAEAGLQVTCLEQGDWQDREAYPGRHDDWELAAFGPWHPHPNIRRSEADYPLDDADSAMKPLMFNGVGGSTILYGGHWMRMLPSDFATRTLDGVGDDWPLGYDDLAPYYDRKEQDFGVSGLAGDPAYPAIPDYPLPPLPVSAWGTRVAQAHNRLGWHWWPGTNAIASRDFDGRRMCVQRGTCGWGCNEGAKASTDLTHWPKAIAAGASLVTRARVSEISIDRSGRVAGAVFETPQDGERRIACDLLVMAASAIGTPRLLLKSQSARHPNGLANASGLVGRRLMMHPFSRVVGFFDEPMQSWQGHWGQSLHCMEFAETDESRGFLRGAKWNLSPSGGPLHAALYPWPDAPRWGKALHEHVGKWLGRSAIWGISCEDLPDPDNRVELAGDGETVKLTYALSDNSRAMLDFNIARAADSFAEAGAYDTASRELMPDFGWHPLGTCRMGDDPETSVVDRWGRAHDVANLVIADGSTFVTGSSVNPAATIAALALRSADRLVATRREAVH